jgi:multidrug efflux pump subunit AcrA (membrane-fusion protein)
MRVSPITWAAFAVAIGVMTAGLLLAGAMAAEQEPGGVADTSDPTKIHDCLITPIKLIPVPAEEAGRLVEVKVQENQQVKKGELLAQIDDRKAVAAKNVADHKLLAAEKEAGNRISVDYARAKNLVAKATYDKGTEANDRVPGTTPAIELLKLKLEVVASKLETDHAEYQLEIAATSVDVRKAELEAAKLDLERLKITAPWDGQIVKREREDGEWVKPGDPVFQMVQMDHLRIEASLDGARLGIADVDNRPVSVKVATAPGREVTVEGRITYVSPLVEAGNRFLVKVDVANRQNGGHWLLRPGMKAEMTIHVKK